MSLSIIIPVRNEEENILETAIKIKKFLLFEFEICFIDDFSSDKTFEVITNYIDKNRIDNIKIYKNTLPGLGPAINKGIEISSKNYLTIMMCDGSDDLDDLKKYYEIISNQNLDAVFGSRFIKGSRVVNYPLKKLILNRIFNYFVSLVFFSKFNDFTNAFKIYNKKSIIKLQPIVSESFNVFLELPLKIIARNMSYEVIPISWKNRKIGKSKFIIKELGAKYVFTLLYCFFEKILLKKNK